ncbi:S8 family serine peptidase [bacterium]|nr:S8 family serine peptidase [bacterium]
MKKATIRQIFSLGLSFLVLVMSFTGGNVYAEGTEQEGPIVDPELLARFDRSAEVGYLIRFDAQADLSAAYELGWVERGQYVVDTLQQLAAESQSEVRNYLEREGIAYEPFWIQNVIAVESSSRAAFEGLFEYTEIYSLNVIPQISLVEPEAAEQAAGASGDRAVEANLTHINADDVWGMGFTGSDLVVGSIDTGVRYTHEALVGQYRGNLGGGSFDHDYNWLDAVSGQAVAYDDHNHGSHTVGIMVGDDKAGNQIGVAPGAEWIACKALNSAGNGTGTDLLECGQFMLAPTQVDGSGANPNLRPQVVNNSWGDCGQSYNDWYEDTIDAWEAAGIYPVFANGNAGNCAYSYPPGLNTVGNPARGYNVTGVGSTGRSDGQYANHSNWGPTDSLDTLNPMGYANIKPQVVAPGVSIRSSLGSGDSSYAYYTGTSMSAPHVSALVALMWQAGSCLTGEYVQTETLLIETAIAIPYDTGNGDEGPGNVPNHATGWGEIDALAAVTAAQNYCGDSTLDGTVTDDSSGDPIVGAQVEAAAQGDPNNDRSTETDENGYYSMPVTSDETYDISVSAYGYYGDTANNVAVSSQGQTVTTNFQLEAKPTVSLTGTVTDGSGHGYPLYAALNFEDSGGVVGTHTDPLDGTYGVTLYQDTDYEIAVSAMLDGYQSTVETGINFSGSSDVRNYALTIGEYCDAPGYFIQDGLYAPFEGEVQPGDWTVTDDAGEGVVWRFDDPAGRSNLTGGEGGFAIADSDYAGNKNIDTSLISPSMDLSGWTTVILTFDQDLFIYAGSGDEVADVDVSVSGGAWQNVLRQTITLRGPNQKTVDISGLAAGQSDVRVRFRYYNANFDWWWQVDTVRVGPYTCGMVEGGGLMGFVTDQKTGQPINGIDVSSNQADSETEATSEDPTLDDGFYWVFQPLGSASETVSFTYGSGPYIEKTVDVGMSRDAITHQDVQLDTERNFMPLFLR